MRFRFLPPLAAAVLLFSFSTSTHAVGGVSALPDGVRQRLDEQYPGWTLAPTAKSVWEEFKKLKAAHHPNLLSSDLDGDGRADWAVQVALTTPGDEEQFITVFLAREGGGWEESIVESRGLDPAVYLWKQSQKVSDFVSGRETTVTRNDLLIRGGPMGDSVYRWEGGQFREVALESVAAPPIVP